MASSFGVPQVDFYSMLSGLGDTLAANRKANLQREALASATGADGTVDYAKAIQGQIRGGDLEGATRLAGIKRAIDPESSADIQAYNLYKSQGGGLPFLDFKKQLAEAGATKVSTTVNNKGEAEYDKALNKDLADTFLGYQKEGRTAGDQLNTIRVMEKASQDPKFYSGAGANLVTAYKKGAASLGIEGADAAAPNELFGKMSNKLVIDSLGSLGTGVSNADRAFMESTVPNLQNTPEGNKAIFDAMRKVAQRKQEIAKLATEYAAKNGGRIDYKFNQVLQDYAEKNPLFPQASQSGQGNQPAGGQPPVQGAKQGRDGNWYLPDPSRPGKYLQVVQ